MDIFVKGMATKNFKPNQIAIDFNFIIKEKSYDKCIEKGVNGIEDFVKFLLDMGFNKDDFKTTIFTIREDKIYDDNLKKYEDVGYVFNQNGKLSFDYNLERLSKIISSLSLIKLKPTFNISFNLKDKKLSNEELLKLAYFDAEKQAKSIAEIANLKVVRCQRTSFEPFNEKDFSNTHIEGRDSSLLLKTANYNLQDVFVPEDIVLSTTLFCHFIAE